MVIDVPTLALPTVTLCNQQGDDMVRCDRPVGHTGLHAGAIAMALIELIAICDRAILLSPADRTTVNDLRKELT